MPQKRNPFAGATAEGEVNPAIPSNMGQGYTKIKEIAETGGANMAKKPQAISKVPSSTKPYVEPAHSPSTQKFMDEGRKQLEARRKEMEGMSKTRSNSKRVAPRRLPGKGSGR